MKVLTPEKRRRRKASSGESAGAAIQPSLASQLASMGLLASPGGREEGRVEWDGGAEAALGPGGTPNERQLRLVLLELIVGARVGFVLHAPLDDRVSQVGIPREGRDVVVVGLSRRLGNVGREPI